MKAYEFIRSNIDRTTKTHEGIDDEGTLIRLPYPFTTPCAEGMFQEMYYWDTYFTQKALYLTGRREQAANNVKNFIYLLDNYGKIPNGNRTYFLNNSQPPFFGLMLRDLLASGSTAISIENAYESLVKEYAFWNTYRRSENGLNHYNTDVPDEENPDTINWYKDRTGKLLDCTVENCRCIRSEAESGWDFTSRFLGNCTRCNAVDLNSLLYADERLLAAWAEKLGKGEKASFYTQAAEVRKQKMRSLMRGQDGVWYDYNYRTGERTGVISCAAFFPFFVGIEDDRAAYEKTLSALEREHGIVASRTDARVYQWAEPNSWAPLNYIAVAAAERAGWREIALRLAKKYLATMDGIYEKTERLWEKFNAETGNMDVISEYGTPEMLGWTAGVYVAFLEYAKSGTLL